MMRKLQKSTMLIAMLCNKIYAVLKKWRDSGACRLVPQNVELMPSPGSGITRALKMESPTDNGLQDSVWAGNCSAVSHHDTGTQGKNKHTHQTIPYCSTNCYRDIFPPCNSLVECPPRLLSPVSPAYLFSRLTYHPSLNPQFLSCLNLLLTCTILLLFICMQVF